MESNLDYLFVILLLFSADSIIMKMLKHGGFKGGMFGACIQRTIGEIPELGPALGVCH